MQESTVLIAGERKLPSGFLSRFARSPQQTLLRRAMFQIHLWTGLLLAVYVALIGLSGSITVFRMDLAMQVPRDLQNQVLDPHRVVSVDVIHRNLRLVLPDGRILSTLAPDEDRHAFASMVGTRAGRFFVTSDPYTGKVLRSVDMKKNWAFVIGEFHENLLAGEVGKQVSAVASVLLLLVLGSGLLVWWRGLRRWTRALGISFRASWKRVNYDVHCSVGFWTLLFCAMWCVTTVVMVWPKWSTHAIGVISPITDAVKEPEIIMAPRAGRPCTIHPQEIIDHALAADPGTRFAVYSLAPRSGGLARIYLARGRVMNRGTWDVVFVDPCTANVQSVWHRWKFKSMGDVIIAGSRLAHVGFLWGFWAQITWALVGLAFPVLAVTCVLMYWNRYLGKRWAALRQR